MLLPIGTDAPVYHFPWMTIVLIVGNVFSFVLTGSGSRTDGWLLQFGNGLHPVEWLAWNFLHFGFMHLLGNMFFLWAFGLVVEGKIGWWKYLLVYLGVGIVGGFVVQLIMLGTDVPKLPDGAQMTAQMVPSVQKTRRESCVAAFVRTRDSAAFPCTRTRAAACGKRNGNRVRTCDPARLT